MDQRDSEDLAIGHRRRQAMVEIALIFIIFSIQGAWPVPDVNEPYYLGKAIHFWNPDWIPHDFFLDSSDTHQVFYFSFGWLALWLSPTVLAWVGRLTTWGLLAWAWRRLSWTLVPRRWLSVVTAAVLVCLWETCSMAGEWVVGGVEAKGFAYVFVLLGMEAVVRERWNRAWLLFGGAALFHVLVGGWAVVAGGVAWWLSGPQRPKLRSMWPALLGGGLLSLPGLIPAIGLTWGVDPAIVRQADIIYVYQRLAHHLVFSSFPRVQLERFGVLLVVWLVLCRLAPRNGPTGRLQGFVAGTIAIASVGMAINLLMLVDPARAAGLLRFYWFRLVDVAIPIGVALLGVWWIGAQLGKRPLLGKGLLAVVSVVVVFQVGSLGVTRLSPSVPRTIRPQDYDAWCDVCKWIAESPEIPSDARFLTPRLNHTFQWYTGRSEVASWKNIPQDANSIVEWWDRLDGMYGTGSCNPEERWRCSLTRLEPEQIMALGKRYDAGYLLTSTYPPLGLKMLYHNYLYAVYRLEPDDAQ